VSGGTIPNVVPETAEAVFDVRALCATDLRWAISRMAPEGERDGLEVRVTDTRSWPGIEEGPGGRLLAAECETIAATLGAPVRGQVSGGMSDGCWTAALGVPTIDGLGPVGGRDHSPREYARLDSVPARCGLVAGLCAAVGGGLLDERGMLET
jgi:glutamate carboxypeptidase